MIYIHRFAPCGVSVCGHAGAGAAGHDLVCAAVSALTLTLGSNVISLEQEGLLKERQVRLQRGKSHISCAPKPQIAPAVELIFDTVCQGFALLSRLFPKHVQLTILN